LTSRANFAGVRKRPNDPLCRTGTPPRPRNQCSYEPGV